MQTDKTLLSSLVIIAVLGYSGAAHAMTFQNGSVSGDFDNTITLGTGIRTQGPQCGQVIGTTSGSPTPPTGAGAPSAGCMDAFSFYNDQGNLNYAKGHPFTTYLDGTDELLLKFPKEWQFFGRVNWVKDFSATNATGIISGGGTGASFPGGAGSQLSFKARLLDLWVSHTFLVGGNIGRFRVGNQVLDWGESLFLPGGINATNAVDLMRLSVPGAQLKEAVLPAPIADASISLPHGLSLEGYVQGQWNGNYFPPVGSYWSTATIGSGAAHYGSFSSQTRDPGGGGQYGLALRYSPEALQANFGLYAMQYTDKAPVISYEDPANATGAYFHYLRHRVLLGASTDFQLGDWALGGELSYRPHDAVSLNTLGTASNGQYCLDGNCYVDKAKYQLDLTAMLSLSPSDNPTILHLLGNADTATLMAEAAMVDYPGLQSQYNGVPVSASYWGYGFENASSPFVAQAKGTAMSWGYNLDFSWTYDGTLLHNWQVTPAVYYFQAVHGYTPNSSGLFMQGAKSANLSVTFTHDPGNWSWGVNYALFRGPGTLVQPLLGRNYVGAYATINF